MAFWQEFKSSGLLALSVGMPTFLWLMATCSVLQAAVLPLYLVGLRKLYYSLSARIFTVIHTPLIYLFQYSGSKVFLHGKNLDTDVLQRVGFDQAMLLVNHRGDLDWLVGLMILHNGGGMGSCKAIIKKSLLLVPFFGFIWWAVDFVCVSRNWDKDEATLKTAYARQHDYRQNAAPYVLNVFPEGTRFAPKKLEDSQAWAKSRGKRVLNHLLCPRVKGVWSAMNGLKLDSVFNATLTPGKADGGQANMLTLAKAQPVELHFHVERLSMADIPREEDKLGEWLFKLWSDKEDRLETFAKEGGFGKDSGVCVPLVVHSTAGLIMSIAVAWYAFCALAYAVWCVQTRRFWLLGGSVSSFVAMMATCMYVLKKVHFTKSSHGTGKKKAA